MASKWYCSFCSEEDIKAVKNSVVQFGGCENPGRISIEDEVILAGELRDGRKCRVKNTNLGTERERGYFILHSLLKKI